MRKSTLSMLILFVSVFFISHTVFGQAMHTKTTEVLDYIPVVQVAKTNDALMADSYSIDFEAEDDWTAVFTPWTTVDNDLLSTYTMTGVTWPGGGDPQAFIVFNPSTTDPPLLDDDEIQPHSGEKFGACLASVPDGSNGNDDWFISDMVSVGDGANFNFWAKSYTDQYGLERMNVAVSTTTPDPGEFTVISGSSYIEVPMAWTEYNFDLSDYAGMDIYVAIQCVSYDAFVFMIDDLMIDPGAAGGDCENFDSYAVGSYVAEEVEGWTTWSNNPGSAEDALITDAEAFSPDNSFIIEGGTDLVQLFDAENITSGVYMYSNMMYVADGSTGYFNLQKDVVPGVEWGFQAFFDGDGTATIDAGAAAASVFTFTFEEWHTNTLIVDLDNDYCEYWFDGEMMVSYQWSLGTFGTAGAMTLGGANYYANAGVGPALAYFDDVCFAEYVISDCENFDALTVGDYVAGQLGGYWTTWGGTPGGADDALVTDVESNSPDNSFVVDGGNVDLIFQFGDDALATGQWLYSHYMYVPTGFSGYFNVQSDPTPGVDWNLELFFNDDGTGEFAGQSSETFTYDMDTWIMIEINYDLDAGLAQVYFDGSMIIQFENSMTIGSIDYYGWDVGGPPGAYYDDVCFGEGWEISTAMCEDFDDLTVGGYVAEQLGGYWTTWGGTPGGADDAPVSDDESNSPDNSFVVNSGAIDLIYQFGDEAITSGQWKYSHYIFVPGDYSGYFNVQSDPTPGVDWNLDIFFNDGGEGELGSQSSATFTYPQDTWILVEINYDLDAGYAWVIIDGQWVDTFENTMSIGGIDYYGLDQGGPPGAFYDDVCFEEGDIYTGIEEPTIFTSNIYPNPARDQITIESESIIDEVRIYNNMGQLVYSGEFNNSQIMVNTSNYLTGMYIVQIRSGEAVEVRKLIVE